MIQERESFSVSSARAEHDHLVTESITLIMQMIELMNIRIEEIHEVLRERGLWNEEPGLTQEQIESLIDDDVQF
ncbi:MAG: hypothetical protein ACI4UJ_10245 [Candidatus Cryptobacteroides sp.]